MFRYVKLSKDHSKAKSFEWYYVSAIFTMYRNVFYFDPILKKFHFDSMLNKFYFDPILKKIQFLFLFPFCFNSKFTTIRLLKGQLKRRVGKGGL